MKTIIIIHKDKVLYRTDKVDLRARIAAYMLRKDMSQKEMADIIGCRPNNFYDYMTGKRNLTYDCVEKVLTLL